VARMALEGIRVLDFTQMMMGPWATQFLADMGAEVIKVERPRVGEWERGLPAAGQLLGGQSAFFLAMNRNKKSLALNLKDPRARDVIRKLAATCDLVTENFRPGVLDRLGMGYEDLRQVNPSIVYVSGTGFGADGPYVRRPGQDLLIQAMTGLAAYGGRRGGPPTPCGSSVVDASTALLLAYSAMVALFHRERTGEGQKVEVNLFATAVALQCQEFTAFLNSDGGFERSEAGIGGAWLAAPFGIYQTADGWLALSMMSLATLGEVLGMPELAAYQGDETAFRDRDEVKRLLEPVILGRTTAAWMELLGQRDLWCAPVQDFADLEHDPQVEHAGLIQTVAHPGGKGVGGEEAVPGGKVRVVGVPMRFSATPGAIKSGPPAVGQHTDEVLRGLGYTGEAIRALHEDGVV
jgi:crotonobetainyl-CoA:carnitine CoA-transferase CaiB-like acyl-CoA transferase